MGLSSTLHIAQQALATNAALSTIVSRNIAGVNDPNYTTKTALVVTTVTGGVTIAGIRNATDDALFNHLLSAQSTAASSSALSGGLDQIEQTLGLASTNSADATSTDTSPATLISTLTSAVQSYANAPASPSLGQAAVTAAKSLALNLRAASATVSSVRQQADQGIAAAVASVNSLLAKFGTANTAVIAATTTGADATDAIDARNSILSQLSSQIGIATANAGNGGLAIYTDGGATLFQGSARTVSFATTSSFTSGTVGNAVIVDGVPITGAGAVMPSTTGAISGLAQLRDVAAVSYGNQLDQIAGGLISAFKETDQSGQNPIAGLFTAGGSATLPTSTTGLAASIAVPAAVDFSQGGSVALLRDGGINANGNAAYTANATGAASYADHLSAMLTALAAPQGFDPTSGGTASGSLANYANSSVAWLETTRQSADSTTTDTTAAVTRTTTSLSAATGVNLDDQLSQMLDLEHSYSASAELMTTVKSMLDALLAAVN